MSVMLTETVVENQKQGGTAAGGCTGLTDLLGYCLHMRK